MQVDETDLKILVEFCKLKSKEEKPLSEIVKSIYKKNYGDKEYMIVKRKILRLAKDGLFEIGKNLRKTYILNPDKVFLRRFSLPTRRSNCIVILSDNRYTIFEI